MTDKLTKIDYSNNLIFGKDKREGLVSVEVVNDQIELFYIDKTYETLPMTYWVLASKKLDPHFFKLNGNNHYKYMKTFSNRREFNDFVYKNKNRYDIYSIGDPKESAMIYHGFTLFKGLTVEDLGVLSFDIEADSLARTPDSTTFLITNTYTKGNHKEKFHLRLDDYENPGDMIDHWCEIVREEIDPDVINGHNVFGYDLDYLRHVASLYGTSLKLGRNGDNAFFSKRESKYRVDGNQDWKYTNCSIYGRHVIDGMFLSVKYDFARNYPSWGLKAIAEYEGLVSEDRQFYDASKIRENWHDPIEREKIVKYGCFLPESAVITKDDGSADYIENITIKDRVISHKGYSRAVTKTYKKHYKGNIYHLVLENGRSIKNVTEEHPWYVLNETTNEFEWIKTKDLKIHHKLKLEITPKKKRKICIYDKDSNDFWWLLGLIQADGYVRIQKNNKYPCITQHKDQSEEIIKCLNKLNLRYVVIDNEKSKKKNPAKTYDFIITDSIFGEKILDYCGGKYYAPDKKLKKAVYEYLTTNRKSALSFISGLYDGDGHLRETSKNGWQAMLTTTSKSLANIVDRLLTIHGINIKLERRDRLNNRHHPIHRIYVLGTECQKLNEYLRIKHSFVLKNHKYTKTSVKKLFSIKKINVNKYSGVVYNIEVEKDNSYLVNNLCSHNCDDSDDSNALYYLQIPSFFYLSQSIPKPFQKIVNSASGSWLNSIMVRSYLQDGHSIPKASDSEYVAGGMSYGIPGVYSNVTKWDADSYYPSTILAFDIYDKDKDPKANFLEMVRYFTNKRFEQKAQYKETGDKFYEDLQASSKIFINSAYGLLGTPGLNFNSYQNASLITACCRKGLQKCVEWATGKTIDHYWGVDEKLYKEVDNVLYEDIVEKYDKAFEMTETGSYLVPRHRSGENWKVCYKHSRTATQDFEDYSYIDQKSKLSYEDMPRHDWELVNIDTDSLSFTKKDGSEFTQEECEMIHKELNEIMYSGWSDDGMFDRVLVVKAKNYILQPKGSDKYKIKGSSILDAKKEPALTEMLKTICKDLMVGENNYKNIYNHYVEEVLNIKDITRWAMKKSISEKTIEGNDTSKRKVLDAIKHLEYQVGDKFYLFQDIDGERQVYTKGEPKFVRMTRREYESLNLSKNPSLSSCKHKPNLFCMECNPQLFKPKMEPNDVYRVVDQFTGTYDKWHYMKRLYNTISILEPVLDMEGIINYNLMSNRDLLDEIN